MAPFCHPKTTKFQKKTISKMHQKKERCLHRVLDHLGSILGAKLGPNFGPNWGTPWEATLFFGALFCFSYFFAILTPREGGTPSDRLHFGRFLGPCWHHFGSIFVSLGAFDFGGLWCHVSTHFCKFWRPELNQTHVRNRGFSFSAFSIASICLPGLPPYMIFRSTILPCS